MKHIIKSAVTLLLLLSLTLSFAGCTVIEQLMGSTDTGNSQNSGDNVSNNQGNTDTENGNLNNSNQTDSGDSESDKESLPEDDDNNAGNESEKEDNEEEKDEEEKEEEEESLYLDDTELPHFDYFDTINGKYNSSLFYANDYDIGVGDPTVYYREESDGGWFYVTGTTTGRDFSLWKTKNFTDWIALGTIYSITEDFFGVESLWAPQIFYDENASWSYYLGKGNGKGLYVLFFSAKDSSGMFRLAVAFSKDIDGTYTNFVGYNANGDYIDKGTTCFEIEKLKGLGLYSDHVYGDLYKARRGFIDASPYIDPVSGDKYLYMVRNRTADTSNDVWGVKMKDWVTPDYSTTTPLTAYGYTTIEKTEKLNYTTRNKIDEGPFLYYKDNTDDGKNNGKYYLTYSIGDTNDKMYPVFQAIGDSPLGPFTKLQPDELGIIITPDDLWDIHSSGHHCFFEADGELFIGYHTYTISTEDNTYIRRYFGMAKVQWVYNENGDYVMRANGPSKDIQPLPEAVSKYENILKYATEIKANGTSESDLSYLTDGLITLRENDGSHEYEFNENTVITIDFEDYITARAILIYNSYDYNFSFDKIDKIEFSYRKKISGKYYYGKAYIEDLGFNFKHHLIPQYYLLNMGETNMNQLRPTGAAIAEFGELEISSIRIEISVPERSESCRISEITVLGTTESAKLEFGISKGTPFLTYRGFTVSPLRPFDDTITLDGVLDESIWTDCKNTFTIEGTVTDATTGKDVDVSKYGERSAKVYTYIGDKYVYFAFEVTDKNLFYHAGIPQGRSTAVEIYLASSSIGSLSNGCYSIRINPIGDGNFKLGTYIPNNTNSEWTETNLRNKVRVGVKINGNVQTSAGSYDRSENTGYVIEIAIDKSLIGGTNANNFIFTAAFVQMKEYGEARMGNSFIAGTSYVKPETWLPADND